jgi:hypothetical protein
VHPHELRDTAARPAIALRAWFGAMSSVNAAVVGRAIALFVTRG